MFLEIAIPSQALLCKISSVRLKRIFKFLNFILFVKVLVYTTFKSFESMVT